MSGPPNKLAKSLALVKVCLGGRLGAPYAAVPGGGAPLGGRGRAYGVLVAPWYLAPSSTATSRLPPAPRGPGDTRHVGVTPRHMSGCRGVGVGAPPDMSGANPAQDIPKTWIHSLFSLSENRQGVQAG